MIFNSKKEALKYMQENGVDTSTLTEEFWQSINISTAQPEFQVIAEMLYDLYQEANWKESKYHIPFYDDIVRTYCVEPSSQATQEEVDEFYKLMMLTSASMCAKLSYNTQDNEDTLEKHLERANMLIESKHWEPFSHQAVAMDEWEVIKFYKSRVMSIDKFKNSSNVVAFSQKDDKVQVKDFGWCYNLRGFKSFRYILENEQYK